MRYLLVFLTAVVLSGCVSSGKYKKYVAVSEALFTQQADSIRFLQDSTLTMRLAVERAAGRDDAYRSSQDKYLTRLQEQSDALDALRGNLSTTNSQMGKQLAEARRELAEFSADYDTLLVVQERLIAGFQEHVESAAAALGEELKGKVDSLAYTITVDAGIVTLSVREDLLFRPGTVNRTQDETSFILRAVTNALQSDPLLKLLIVGHTDNQPNPRRGTDNWSYAALRASYLADQLNQVYYLSPNRILAASHGEFGPVASNATADGRQLNRRVDFVLRNNVGNLLRNLGQLGEEEEKEE